DTDPGVPDGHTGRTGRVRGCFALLICLCAVSRTAGDVLVEYLGAVPGAVDADGRGRDENGWRRVHGCHGGGHGTARVHATASVSTAVRPRASVVGGPGRREVHHRVDRFQCGGIQLAGWVPRHLVGCLGA